MFGRTRTPPPTPDQLRAGQLTSTAPWVASGLRAEVVVQDGRRRPVPHVLLGYDGGETVIGLPELEQMAAGKALTAESDHGYPTLFLADPRAIAPDSAAGEVTRGIEPGHVVVVGPGADPRRDPMRVHAVLPAYAVGELAAWARRAADAEIAARARAQATR